MSLLNIHDRLAISAVLFAGVCAAWGFINYIRKQDMTSGYWGALAICEIPVSYTHLTLPTSDLV